MCWSPTIPPGFSWHCECSALLKISFQMYIAGSMCSLLALAPTHLCWFAVLIALNFLRSLSHNSFSIGVCDCMGKAMSGGRQRERLYWFWVPIWFTLSFPSLSKLVIWKKKVNYYTSEEKYFALNSISTVWWADHWDLYRFVTFEFRVLIGGWNFHPVFPLT